MFKTLFLLITFFGLLFIPSLSFSQEISEHQMLKLQILPPSQPLPAGNNTIITLIIQNNFEKNLILKSYQIHIPYEKEYIFSDEENQLPAKSLLSFPVIIKVPDHLSAGNSTLVVNVNTMEGHSTSSWVNIPIKDETLEISERMGNNIDAILLLLAFYAIPAGITERLLQILKRVHRGKDSHRDDMLLKIASKESFDKLKEQIITKKVSEIVNPPSISFKKYSNEIKTIVTDVCDEFVKNDKVSQKEVNKFLEQINKIVITTKDKNEIVEIPINQISKKITPRIKEKINEIIKKNTSLADCSIKVNCVLDKFVENTAIPSYEKKIISMMTKSWGGVELYSDFIEDIDKRIAEDEKIKGKHQTIHEVYAWLAGVGIGMIFSSFMVFHFDVGFMKILGYTSDYANGFDLVVNALFIASGTKPIHDAIEYIRKARSK